MSKLLRIDGSIRESGSRSRQLGDEFVSALADREDVQVVNSRRVGTEPPAAPTDAFRIANHTSPAERTAQQSAALAESDQLIDELLACDLVLLTTPMYNFSVGAGVKNWVDNLIRKDRTFRIGTAGIERLAEGKRMVVLSSRGLSYAADSPFATCDHLNPWIRDIFGFIGIEEISFIMADNLDFAGPDAAQQSMASAREQIRSLVNAW